MDVDIYDDLDDTCNTNNCSEKAVCYARSKRGYKIFLCEECMEESERYNTKEVNEDSILILCVSCEKPTFRADSKNLKKCKDCKGVF